MEKVRFIGSKRRTNTPISYRQRVVQYRHRPFLQHAIYKSEKLSKSESVMNQLIPQKFVEDIKFDENFNKAKNALGDVGGKMKSFFSDAGHKAKESSQHAWQLLQEKCVSLKDDFQKKKEERLEKQKALQVAKQKKRIEKKRL